MKASGFVKDPWSAYTHAIGLALTCVAAVPLLIKASGRNDPNEMGCMLVFILSMVLLYAASTIYHTLDLGEKKNRILQRLDHSAISILIAGTYTPPCMLAFRQPTGRNLCILVWSIAIAGIVIKLFWISCPRWFSSLLYIGMGWACVTAFPSLLHDLPRPCFYWFLAGGVLYTVGGIIYALKLRSFNEKHKNFGTHEIFHLFVMGGSFCHYIAIYVFIA